MASYSSDAATGPTESDPARPKTSGLTSIQTTDDRTAGTPRVEGGGTRLEALRFRAAFHPAEALNCTNVRRLVQLNI